MVLTQMGWMIECIAMSVPFAEPDHQFYLLIPTQLASRIHRIMWIPQSHMPLNKGLSLLRLEGTSIQLGSPEDRLPALSAHTLIHKSIMIRTSMIMSSA